jgi:hypothetical protein
MPAVSKLLPAALAGMLALSLADGASASPKRLPLPSDPAPVEQPPPPARAPRQFFPEMKVQPLTPDIEQALIPKDSFKECDACPEMVVVPKGSFMMGTPADEPVRFRGEDPIHRVSFAKPFAVGLLWFVWCIPDILRFSCREAGERPFLPPADRSTSGRLTARARWQDLMTPTGNC